MIKFYRGECLGSPHAGYGGAGTITLRTSVEKSADTYQKTSKGKGGLGTKTAKVTASKSNVSESAVKLLKPC